VACVNFIVQMFGMAILATATAPAMLYLGCALFGLGVANTTSLPGLLVQQEFPKQHFARIVSLVVAINQFSFAFGPTLLGQLEQAEGSYTTGPCCMDQPGGRSNHGPTQCHAMRT
jgi:MFS family permease